tara:strand:+ start:5717 stop:6499 length:783 start_codon:yes stop_codon:yes gene_type:complete
MKKNTCLKDSSFLMAFLLVVSFGFGQMNDLIISEYAEGSSNNKYVEIFNGTGADVDLTDYQVWKAVNGGTFPPTTGFNLFNLSGTLVNGDTYIIANISADPTIIAAADLVSGNANWNGNDAVGIAKDDGTGTFLLIDAVGTDGADPVTGWDVAGTTNATQNNTLVRKAGVCGTNINWTTSAGTTVDNSEWVVLDNNNWSDIGTHTTDCCIYSSTWTAAGWIPSTPTPSINTNVIIDAFYDTNINTSFTACSLTLKSASFL